MTYSQCPLWGQQWHPLVKTATSERWGGVAGKEGGRLGLGEGQMRKTWVQTFLGERREVGRLAV